MFICLISNVVKIYVGRCKNFMSNLLEYVFHTKVIFV